MVWSCIWSWVHMIIWIYSHTIIYLHARKVLIGRSLDWWVVVMNRCVNWPYPSFLPYFRLFLSFRSSCFAFLLCFFPALTHARWQKLYSTVAPVGDGSDASEASDKSSAKASSSKSKSKSSSSSSSSRSSSSWAFPLVRNFVFRLAIASRP